MATYYRVTTLAAAATVLRQGINVTGIDVGDFIYPEEIETIVCTGPVGYWDDNTCEHFVWTPGNKSAPVSAPAPAPKLQKIVEPTPE